MARPVDDTTLNSVPSVAPAPRAGSRPQRLPGGDLGAELRGNVQAQGRSVGARPRASAPTSACSTTAFRASTPRSSATAARWCWSTWARPTGRTATATRVQRHELNDGDKISIGATTILRFTYQDQVDEQYQKKLFESALRDGLTSTFNRRYFVDRLQAEIRFAVRHDKSLALLFVDIDHFKKINDTHGHLAGDQVLAGVARVMTSTIRAEDVLARYGGEEFAVICREIERDGARALGERLRVAVAAAALRARGQGHSGHRQRRRRRGAQDRATRSAFIAAADAAMYEAKRAGRNRVCIAPGPEVAGAARQR